jgi:hypothetical protein
MQYRERAVSAVTWIDARSFLGRLLILPALFLYAAS